MFKNVKADKVGGKVTLEMSEKDLINIIKSVDIIVEKQ